MSDKDKLFVVMSVLKETKKEIEKALKKDCEVDLGGNGINCSEANKVIEHIFEEIEERTK